jgi:hypothetical protein
LILGNIFGGFGKVSSTTESTRTLLIQLGAWGDSIDGHVD